MKLEEALNAIDKLKPNQFDDVDKIKWIQELDGIVTIEVLNRSAEFKNAAKPIYTDQNKTVSLIIEEPYTDLYIRYAHAQIDFMNGEYERYNNNTALFNARYEDYRKYFLRNHIPYQVGQIKNV